MKTLQDNPGRLFPLAGAAVLGLAVLILYWPILGKLFQRLVADEDFSYGLLLPLVSAYLIYLKWPRLRSLPLRPSWWGIVFIGLGFGLYTLGKLAADSYSPPFSFILVLSGGIILLGGWGLARQLLFPLVLLVLTIPPPSMIIGQLTLPLQLISSRLAALFLRLLGIPIVRDGNVIDLGFRQLQVVAACSGLRYILALLALGLIYCYFYQRRIWKAAVLLVAIIPAAIIANSLRVAAMGLWPILQEGFWHSFSGWLIFVFCFICLALVNGVLNYLQPSEPVPASGGAEAGGEQPGAFPVKSWVPYVVSGLATIVLGAVLVFTVGNIQPVPLVQSFDAFPLQLGPWEGRRSYIDEEIWKKTEADAYLEADYTKPGEAPVNLWIAYYEVQASPSSAHNPNVCMTGTGWETISSGTSEIAPGHPVNFLIVKRAGSLTPLLVYYWNLQQGQWRTEEKYYKLYMIFNGLKFGRTDWALIRLITPFEDKQGLAAAKERLTSFARTLIPLTPQFFRPQEQYHNQSQR